LIGRIEIKLKSLRSDQLVYFLYVTFIVDVVDLEAELEVLVVKDSEVGLGVLGEILDDSGIIDKIGLEKLRQVGSILKKYRERGVELSEVLNCKAIEGYLGRHELIFVILNLFYVYK
jgi:hypothetical protein